MNRRRTAAPTPGTFLSALLLVGFALEIPHALGAQTSPVAATTPATVPAVTYAPPPLTGVSMAELKKYYAWRNKMDWLLAPIHARADLEKYLKATAKSGSPLDALAPDARRRLLSNIQFGPWGAAVSNYGDLQYLSTEQVYTILALFGEQSLTLETTGGRIRPASPQSKSRSSRPSVVQQRFDRYWMALQTVVEPWTKQAQITGSLYDRLFASLQKPEVIRKLDDADLRLLFRAACMATYPLNPKYARDARMDFTELERRHFAAWPDYRSMYQALVVTRQFVAAQKFYQAHLDAGLTPFPAYRDEAKNAGKGTPTVLVVSATKRELTRRRVNLDAPAQVVVVTDPNCHFARDFDEALQSRPKLRQVLEQHSLWLTPPGAELEFDTLQQWNRAHPRQTVNIMYSPWGWPMTDVMETPVVFFLQHGKLVTKHVGWRGNVDFPAIEAGLKAIGLWQ